MSRDEARSTRAFDMQDLPPGSYLLSGPVHIGKLDFTTQFLTSGADGSTAGMVVSTNTSARTVCNRIEACSATLDGEHGETEADHAAALFREYGVIDCVSGSYADGAQHDGIVSVSSPGDLTTVEVRLTDQLERLESASRDHARVCYHSLSTVLMYAERQSVFQFLNVLSSRLATVDTTALFSIDPAMHEDRTIRTLAQAVDGILELRRPESAFEIKGVGIPAAPSSWTPVAAESGTSESRQSHYVSTGPDIAMNGLESRRGETEETDYLLDSAALLSKKWNPIVVRTLADGDGLGFSDLETEIGGISAKVLTDALEELQEYGVVERTEVSQSPLRVEYALTERGVELETVIQSLADWGETHLGADDEQVVLVADDDRRAVTMHTTWLEEEYTVRTAEDGEAARRKLDADVDVAVLDRRMPGLSGDEVLDWLRRQDYDCRVVMVTGEEPTPAVLEMGFDEYLTKPVLRDDLRDTVAELFERAKHDRRVRQYLALRSKLATLEAERPVETLDASEKYAAYRQQLQSLEDDIADLPEDAAETFERIDLEGPR